VGKVSCHYHKVTKGVTLVTEWLWLQHVTGSHITSNIRTIRDEVHSYNSSCIYSAENQIGTLLNSSCNSDLEGD